jgi:hypothetical protein
MIMSVQAVQEEHLLREERYEIKFRNVYKQTTNKLSLPINQ